MAGGGGRYRQGGREGVPEGGLAIRARDELGSWYDDAEFAVPYGARGRPGISPAQLAMVTVLQSASADRRCRYHRGVGCWRAGPVAMLHVLWRHEGSIVFRTVQDTFTEEDLRTGIALSE
jgi:hypothetical protein